jgi:hypothetical protein
MITFDRPGQGAEHEDLLVEDSESDGPRRPVGITYIMY